MLQAKRLVRFSDFTLPHLEDGVRSLKLKLLGHLGVKDYITLKGSLKIALLSVLLLHKNKKSVIVEFPQLSKKMTLKDKLSLCQKHSHPILLLKILVLELIGSEKVLSPFYIGHSQENLKKWWWLTETGYQDSVLNYWRTSLITSMSNSWFLKKQSSEIVQMSSAKTYCHLSTYSIVDKWVKDDTVKRKHQMEMARRVSTKETNKYAPIPKEGVLRTKRIKIYPNKAQKNKLKEWIGTSRSTYNLVLSDYNEKINRDLDIKTLRSLYVNNNPETTHLDDWAFNTPKDIREYTVMEFKTSLLTNLTKVKQKVIEEFKMKYRSKKDLTQTIQIPKSAIKINKDHSINIYQRTGIKNLKIGERLSTIIESDIKLSFKKPSGWYIYVSYRVIPKYSTNSSTKICALDPGLSNFQTISDTEGNCFIFGECPYKYMKHRHELIAKYNKKLAHLKEKTRVYTITKHKLNVQYLKLRYMVDDLHLKTIKFLTDTYDIILLPSFNVRNLIKEKDKVFNKRLLCLAHYRFKQRLIAKCEATGKKLVIVNEAYTSKTCSDCGYLNNNLGKLRTFKCPHCPLEIDRDINASINILHKSISKPN